MYETSCHSRIQQFSGFQSSPSIERRKISVKKNCCWELVRSKTWVARAAFLSFARQAQEIATANSIKLMNTKNMHTVIHQWRATTYDTLISEFIFMFCVTKVSNGVTKSATFRNNFENKFNLDNDCCIPSQAIRGQESKSQQMKK